MPRLKPQFIFGDCSAGMITGVRAELCPPNSVELALNLDVDDVYGEARGRKGCTVLDSQIAGSADVTGLYQFLNSAGNVSKLQAVVAGTIYHYTGGAWTDSGETGTDTKTRFITFLDEVARLNGEDTVKTSTNGSSWGSSSVLDSNNFPEGKFGTVYKDQVITAGVDGAPDTLYISSVPSAGSISWTSNNRSITINPEDGQNITALGEIAGLLLVWKDKAMYTWNNRSTEADEIIRVGCSSQESVTPCGNVLAFFNQQGVYLTSGSFPVLISRSIQKWIDGMSASYYTEVSAFGNEKYLYVSIGDCTVDGIDYTNVVLKYSVNTQEWRVYSYADEFLIFASYFDGSSYNIVGGSDASTILQIESSSTTDNGTDIRFDLQSQDLFFGSRGIEKEISERIMAYTENAQSLTQVKVDGGDWQTIGMSDKEVNNFGLTETITGNKIKFRCVGISKNRGHIQGLEIPKIETKDYN